MKRFGPEAIEKVKPMLEDEAQLLRYDAASALLEFGGPAGKALVKEYQPREKQPWLKSWLGAALESDEPKK
jgi:hypothetical protein